MSKKQQNSPAPVPRITQLWRATVSAYQRINRLTHHLVGFVLKTLVVAYFVFCGLFLTLRYVVLPNISHYKSNVEQIVSGALGSPISIGTIAASWDELQPKLTLTDVVVLDQRQSPALSLPQVAATLSWRSLLLGTLRLDSLEIDRPDLQIERDTQGNLFVAGIPINTKSQKGGGADWVLSQNQIVIRQGRVSWNDKLRGAPELTLTNVNLVLRNRWRQHRLSLQAAPPATFAAPIDVRAEFTHPAFARNKADVSRWKGTLYANVQNTDLTLWKAYVDYPIELNQGKGAVKAWLDLDHARVVDFAADIALTDLSARLRKDLALLSLRQVHGRISAQEVIGPTSVEGAPTFGANGHHISLTDFSFETTEGLVLPRTSIKESYAPARGNQPEKYTLSADRLVLQTLADFAQRLPLTKPQVQMLNDYAPRGELQDFSAQWQGAYPSIVAYRLKGEFKGFTTTAQPARAAQPKTASQPAQTAVPAVPGLDNANGSIDVNQSGGSLIVASDKMTVTLPGYFEQPVMPLEHLDLKVHWQVRDGILEKLVHNTVLSPLQHGKHLMVQVDSLNFVQDGLIGSLSGSYLLPLEQPGAGFGTIDVVGKISEFQIDKIGVYLPQHTPEHLRHWLVGALKSGTARDVAIKLKGDLSHFPFNAPANDPTAKARGEFSVLGKIENGEMEYDPGVFGQDGKQPLWPILEKINGTIAVDRTRLQIKADSARTTNVALTNVVATVPDLLSHDAMLNISGSGAGAFGDFLTFVNNSPVEHWIGSFTKDSEGKGNAQLQLDLHIPMAHAFDSKVNGTVQFLNNDVVLQKIIPPLQSVNGKLEFNQKGFNLNGLKGTFLGGPVQASGGTQPDGQSKIKIDGTASLEGLRAVYPGTNAQSVLSHASGASRYSATVAIHEHHTELLVDSSLQGIALNFPAPLRKSANENLPLKFEWVGVPSNDPLFLRDEIRASLGTAIAARYQRQKSVDKDAEWKVLRGGIGVDTPVPEPDSGLVINLSAKSLNLDQWSSLATVANDSSNVNKAIDDSRQFAGITQYVSPEVVAVRASELILMGKKLNNVVVGASHLKNVWQANIDSTQASGYVTWNTIASGHGLGKVTARLSSLIIPENATSDVKEILESKDAATEIPGLDIVAEDFQLMGKKLGRLELVADNVHADVGSEWRIRRLSIHNPDAELKAAGKWTTVDDNNLTNLTYALDVHDAGKLLERFGFAHVLKGTKGRMDGDVTWKGLPFSIDIPSLTGQINLDMQAGQFLKVDPGAAKLLGVLSLQSLPRRLTLDFRDVFSEGFAFDSVTATAAIAEGKATTDNFKMRGVAATVLLSGSADIAQETQNLHVAVLPEINAGAASLAVLAINPVVGIGTFLAQLFLRDPLMRAFTFEYDITGSWKDPVVKKIGHKDDTVEGKNLSTNVVGNH
ncbi:YhdP family protein [Glaciimonas sp. PAMC28666]|uniref:YhdP family protein n=1 Tax=Glaciimonas sp. PAMC28666 TaxID=2807626 RepID=UPI001962E154|nr:YhdP family protein [Glaciimonas sp. PAMC28666]QRX81395.1 TIGR02099 family protein [Glaciimonas sp. PAMC28666]